MNKKEFSYDYIHGTDIYLYQSKKMFRMNTDTAMLAHFMRIEEGDKVLDIGTNNGALLAVASTFHPSTLYGIEIQEDAAALARFNMEHLHITNAEIMCGDATQLTMPKVHVVICNPPYFNTNNPAHINPSDMLAYARHEISFNLESLAKKASEALDEKGRLYLVHRANRIADIITTLRAYRLEVRTIQFVYDKAKEDAVSVLVEAIKDGKVNAYIIAPQVIER